jgi:hypothetical protein
MVTNYNSRHVLHNVFSLLCDKNYISLLEQVKACPDLSLTDIDRIRCSSDS